MDNDMKNDFNPSAIINAVNAHAVNIMSMTQKLNELEGLIKNPVNFARLFSNACKSAKGIDDEIINLFDASIKSNEKLKDSFSRFINDLDRNNLKKVVKNIWLGIWTLITFILGAIIDRFFK